MKTKLTIIPRYAETDQMGIIHHSVYPIWYECGRTAFCKDLGMPYHEMEKKGVALAVINVNVNYKYPAFYGDELTIYTWISSCTKIRVEFGYEIYNQNNELINYGSTMHAWVNDKLRPVNIVKIAPEIYEFLLKTKE
ncbi:MAG TPA: acyl-CoA thioesterase [Acholeplasmataceae bacterium]|nr:acyl-CoA thioesterase [Acholeplasmataceae bacterium]